MVYFHQPEIMIKDYEQWNVEKQHIDMRNPKRYPRARQIWNVKLGVNVGDEANGKTKFFRPVLVLKKRWSMYICVPLTSKTKTNSDYYYNIRSVNQSDANGVKITSVAMLSHIKSLDGRRFYKHKGTLSSDEFGHIQKILQTQLFEESVISLTRNE